MKLAYLVLGPESSGTRLMTRLLIAAGADGDGAHDQRWDDEAPTRDVVVWRRSVPHAGSWPDVRWNVGRLRQWGYHVRAVVMHREWIATARSQIQVGHVSRLDEALSNIQLAHRKIWMALETAGCKDVTGVSYEALDDVKYRVELGKWLDLPHPERMGASGILVTAAATNRKHYG